MICKYFLPFGVSFHFFDGFPAVEKLSLVQLLSCVWLLVTSWTEACQASLPSTISQSMPKFMSTESVMLSNHLILCRSILLLLSVFSSIRVFSSEFPPLHIRWSKFCSFSFSISPSSENSELISFRIEWFDLFAFKFNKAFNFD